MADLDRIRRKVEMLQSITAVAASSVGDVQRELGRLLDRLVEPTPALVSTPDVTIYGVVLEAQNGLTVECRSCGATEEGVADEFAERWKRDHRCAPVPTEDVDLLTDQLTASRERFDRLRDREHRAWNEHRDAMRAALGRDDLNSPQGIYAAAVLVRQQRDKAREDVVDALAGWKRDRAEVERLTLEKAGVEGERDAAYDVLAWIRKTLGVSDAEGWGWTLRDRIDQLVTAEQLTTGDAIPCTADGRYLPLPITAGADGRSTGEPLAREATATSCCAPLADGRHPLNCAERCQDCGGDPNGPGACRCRPEPVVPIQAEPRQWVPGDLEPTDSPKVIDAHRDVWTRNAAGVWESPSTMPCAWAYLLKKWGPLTEVIEQAPAAEICGVIDDNDSPPCTHARTCLRHHAHPWQAPAEPDGE